jgi:methylamine dehydrogenase accessory protein MauD
MSQALLISHVLLWVLVVALALVILALVRQLGVLHERIAPAGALLVGGGPKVGEQAPELELLDLRGRPVRLADGPTLLLFVSPTCPVCKELLPTARRVASEEGLALVLASDGGVAEHTAFVEREELQDLPYVLSMELGLAYQVGKLPYAVLVESDGVIRARGLVNTREHLESLTEARARGVASIQDYLGRGARDGWDPVTGEVRDDAL